MGAQWKHQGRTENAAVKGKLFGKLAKEIQVAAKAGADPEKNHRLRMAVYEAKKASMPRDTVERAIKKGAGLSDDAVHYEVVTYEGFAPHQVPVIVECLTENRQRTAANIRMLFRKGQMGACAWDFDRRGVIEAKPSAPGADAETAAIECGALDLEAGDEGGTRFFTEPTDLDAVMRALTAAGWTVESGKLSWIAKNPVHLEGAAREEVVAFLEELDGDDDVQQLFVGLKG
jgi:YebC/PmpR family DNA-binding regulatory protein